MTSLRWLKIVCTVCRIFNIAQSHNGDYKLTEQLNSDKYDVFYDDNIAKYTKIELGEKMCQFGNF